MMNKRILSFLLAVMLIVGLMPTSVFATENEGEPTPNPVIEPAGDGEDADGITPLTEEDEDIVPQNGEGEEGEGAEPCTVCNEPGCEKTHTQCEVCDAWDCTEHKPCALCGAYDCGGEHEYCTECDKFNCGIDHNAACDKCGVPGCTKAHVWCDTCQKEDCGVSHVWCDTCQKNDCGIDHTVTEPSEETTAPSEGTTVPEEEETEPAGPQVGDKIWIKSGAKVYKNLNNDKSWTLLGNYEVEITAIETDEAGNPQWYRFKFTTLGIGEALLHSYNYVAVADTTEEQPAETTAAVEENVCDCGEDAPENLAQHADSCPRKSYIKTLFEGKTAEEIYAEWETYDEATQTDILNMLEVYDEEKFEELKKLVGDIEEKNVGSNTPDLQPSEDDIALDGIPSGAEMELPVIRGEKIDVLKAVPMTSTKHQSSATGLFDIKIVSGGERWQPDGSVKVTVSDVVETTTEINEDGVEYVVPHLDGGMVEVRHYLDDEEAIRRAISKGTAKFFSIAGISEIFPNEAAALMAVDSNKIDTICYTISSTTNGSVTVNEDGSITFTTDSFSVFQVDYIFVTPASTTEVAELPKVKMMAASPVAMISEDGDDGEEGDSEVGGGEGEEGEEGGVGEIDPNAPVQNAYITTNKTIQYDAANDMYKLILESYLNGNPTTTTHEKIASDIVLVLDQSGSMNYCFYCGAKDALNKSNHANYASKVSTSGTYWNDAEKGSQLHYCKTCKAWFTSSSHSNHKGAEGFLPTKTSSDAVKDAYYFYNAKSTSAKVIAEDLDLSGATQYYWKDGSTYKKVIYCRDCERWYSDSHAHNTDGSVKTKGTQYYPEISLDFQVTYQPFYSACSEREAALREALNRFVEEVKSASVDDNVKNRLAIVGFGSDVSSANDSPASNEILSSKADKADGYNQKVYPVWYNLIDTESERNSAKGTRYLQNALQDMTTTAGQEMIDYALSEYKIKGNTWTGHGMKMAYWILQKATTVDADNDGNADQRNKVIILFTDGLPYRANTDTTTYGYFGAQANDAINYASKATQEMGATVYTIGIFSNADGSLPAPENSGSNNGSNYTKANRFMHLVSSNYPNATKLDNGEEGEINPNLLDGESYYLSPSTTGALSDVFAQIATSITNGGAYIQTMDETTQVRDIVTDEFTIPNGGSGITAYTEEFNGETAGVKAWINDNNAMDEKLVIDVEGNEVSVTGFDFTENYVATDMNNGEKIPRGRKLVIEIPIEVKPDFLGGDGVATNGTASGIYASDGTCFENFVVPDTNIALKTITPAFQSSSIYVSQAAVIPHVANVGYYTVGGTEYRVDGINNGYVDIVYGITVEGKTYTYTIPAGTKFEDLGAFLNPASWKDKDGNAVADEALYRQLTEDVSYPISCTVISSNKPDNKTIGNKNAVINVYMPVITFRDSVMDLGQTADFMNMNTEDDIDGNFVSIKWMHNGIEAVPEVMGDAPTLQYTFSHSESGITQDTEVQVTSLVSPVNNYLAHRVPFEMDLVEKGCVTFYREACGYKNCNFAGGNVELTDPEYINFIVHIDTFDLTITKKGVEERDGNAPFVFRVYSEETGVDMNVVIYGNDSVTIKGLPAGTYTVTETDGYWRYDITQATPAKSQSITPEGTTAAVEFTNKRTEDKWLDDWAKVTNDFGKTSASFGSGIAD